MNSFTIVIPIKDTDKEFEYMTKSISSAIKLNPSELIIGLDKPSPQRIKERALEISKKFSFTNIRFLEVEKSNDWNFQLANILWYCYEQASNDRIFSFDVDSTVNRTILIGCDMLGKDNIALVSFTKKTRIDNLTDLFRFIMYRIRISFASYVFSGNYWIYRPYFFDIIKKENYKKIVNGVDTFLTEAILDSKYKMVTRKEMGVNCMDLQNEEYDWRQFQDGIWFFAHKDELTKTITQEHLKRKIKPKFGFLHKNPTFYIFAKSLAYWRWWIWKGYLWAKKNPNSECVQMAKNMNQKSWNFQGSKYLPNLEWKNRGTGFVRE